MRRIGPILTGCAFLGLIAAAEPEPPNQQNARLEAEVASLRQANASLERRLAESEAEQTRLRSELARTRTQVPRIPMPRYLEPMPIPPDAVPRGEGNIRHYIIPVELKPSPGPTTLPTQAR